MASSPPSSRPTLRPTAVAAAVAALASACAARGPTLPMTAAAVLAEERAPAIVLYLGQPGADGAACGEDLPAAVRRDRALPAALVRALLAGTIAPDRFAECAAHLLPALEAARAAELVDESLAAATRLVRAGAVETDPAQRARLEALHAVVALREPGTAGSPRARDSARADLGERLAAGRLGPVARGAAERLGAALDAERGEHAGRPVDPGAIAALGAAGDEEALVLLARRLPAEDLRREAERALVLVRTARSPFREVRRSPEAVVAAVLRSGVNAVSLDAGGPAEAWLDPARVPVARVRVRQDPARGTASLYAESAGGGLGVLPAVRLPGALRVRVKELTGALTVCEGGRALDPTPCLAAADVGVAAPLARLVSPGDPAIRWRDEVPGAVAADLARRGGVLEAAVRVGARDAGVVAWPVVFERPPDVVLAGARPGEAGPALDVRLERAGPERLVYTVAGAGRVRVVVLERADAPGFRVVSRGARGAPGLPGTDGSPGSDGPRGDDASCPPFERWGSSGGAGGSGGDGSPGAPGGAGGRGGDVSVTVVAPASLRDDTLALARLTVASEGGAGGEGGRGGDGGRGGAGGAGGSGTTCFADARTSFQTGGTDGPRGADGASGPRGADGPAGRAGTVSVSLAAP